MLIGGKITFSMTCRSVDDVKLGVKFTHASQANAIHGENRVEGYHNHKQFIALFVTHPISPSSHKRHYPERTFIAATTQ